MSVSAFKITDAQAAEPSRQVLTGPRPTAALKGMVGNFAAQDALSAAEALYAVARNGKVTGEASKALARVQQETRALADALMRDPILAVH